MDFWNSADAVERWTTVLNWAAAIAVIGALVLSARASSLRAGIDAARAKELSEVRDQAAPPILSLAGYETKHVDGSAVLTVQFPTAEQMADLAGLETITMIGYPNGIWDQKNNLPIVRRGITATNPKHDYNGLPIFVIDCACFPGSSGSPVLIFGQGGYMDAKGNIIMGSGRLLLLGVLFAGPQHEAPGEIRTIEVPLVQVPIALSRIPNNLGFVVHARKLNDFHSMLMAKT